MANQVNVDQHKKILGTLYVVFGSLNLVAVLMVALISSAVIPIHVDDFEVLLAVKIVKYAVITLTFILTTPALIAGIGLLYKKDWALTLAFIIGIIGLLGFPIWTFIGIYSIVIFILAQNNKKPKEATELISGD
ncbi:MAG: hypothetical protein MI975_27245 [Cytophagales bacterium]|nr:hypothetical protein [Cytophagales bacterium]